MEFIHMQKDYMKKGYSEGRAFQLTEKALYDKLQKNRIEKRILRTEALNSQAISYLSYAEQQAVSF